MKQRVKIAYGITLYCSSLLLFVLILYVMHVDRSDASVNETVGNSLKLSMPDTAVIALLLMVNMMGYFVLSVSAPPQTTFAQSLPDEELVLSYFAFKARQSMVSAARILTLCIVF